MMLGRPEGWVCRRCTEWWNWHPYRPPTEQELDAPCAECRKTMDAEERAVEVNRLMMARLSAGPSTLVVPIPSAPTAPTRRQRSAGSELLSKKEAARRLGVDRATTLEGLIASGNLKTVPFNGRVRIPLAEVERVLNEGIPQRDTSRSKARRPIRVNTPKPSDSPGEEIRKLKF
jgi:excisionase family DNA binding protein